MEIRWKQGTRANVNAEKAHAFFETVRAAGNGDLDLDLIVEKSKPKTAILHGEFEWNDKLAGDMYRRDQARYLVRHIEVVRDKAPAHPGRAYEAVTVAVVTEGVDDAKPATRTVFRTTEDILADPVTRAELLGSAIRDALSFKRRYAALSELAGVIRVIDQTIERLQKAV